MKKFFCAVLALAMMLTLAVPAFAADLKSEGKDVTAGYTAPKATDNGTIYSVTIAWEPTTGSDLSYTGKQATYTWDADGLKYTENVDTAAGWSGSAGYTVTVTNKSNAAVDAALTATNTYNLELVKSADSATLGSAAVNGGKAIDFTDTTTAGAAQSETFEYTYKASTSATAPSGDQNGSVTIGTITVTVTGQ